MGELPEEAVNDSGSGAPMWHEGRKDLFWETGSWVTRRRACSGYANPAPADHSPVYSSLPGWEPPRSRTESGLSHAWGVLGTHCEGLRKWLALNLLWYKWKETVGTNIYAQECSSNQCLEKQKIMLIIIEVGDGYKCLLYYSIHFRVCLKCFETKE